MTASFKLTTFLCGVIAFFSFNVASGSIIVHTGFETSGDTWAFTIDPIRFNTDGDEIVDGDKDVWTEIQEFTGDIDSANAGDRFWGMQDLENPNGGRAGFLEMNFANIDVSGHKNVDVSFAYNAIGFDAGDDLEYEVFVDDVGLGRVNIIDGVNGGGTSTFGWETETISIADSASTVRISLYADQNGASDFAGWDSVQITGDTALVPEPSSISILGILFGCSVFARRLTNGNEKRLYKKD